MGQPHHNGRLPAGPDLIRMAEESDGFTVRRKAGLTAINYAYVTGKDEQFRWPRSEMRGLIIDERTGEVLARPFQKFWNFNEAGAAGTDWSEPHVILPKLDGSLVYPSGNRWTTRGGVTDTIAGSRGAGEEDQRTARSAARGRTHRRHRRRRMHAMLRVRRTEQPDRDSTTRPPALYCSPYVVSAMERTGPAAG